MTKSKHKSRASGRHYIDRRVHQILADPSDTGSDDDLLTTQQLAQWLCVSAQWLEIGRCKGYGPPYVRLGERNIRYPRSGVRTWLRERAKATMRASASRSRETEAA